MRRVTLVEAINAVEAADTNLKTADQQKEAATLKFEAAKAAKEVADLGELDAAKAFNSAIAELITAAQAAIRPVPTA